MLNHICPHCRSEFTIKKGSFRNRTIPTVYRFFCKACRRQFSTQTQALSRKDKKPEINQPLFRLLNSGVSQRRAAFIFAVKPATVARKLKKLSRFCAMQNSLQLQRQTKVKTIVFDEMETFEHSKCKPLSIAVVVEEGSRKILSMSACQMPAKGLLTRISLKRYGYRKDYRQRNLRQVFKKISPTVQQNTLFKSDECPRYPLVLRQAFDNKQHQTFKGRRGCVVGQGELKAGGFDPLFSLNHTCAMVRDNIKRLSRRTWCTTKRLEGLQDLLNLYTIYHNQRLEDKKRPPKVLAVM